MIVSSQKTMEETLIEYQNKLQNLKWIFSDKITNVVDSLLKGNYTDLIDNPDTLSVWKTLFCIPELNGWLLYVLTKAVDERASKIATNINKESGTNLCYVCKIESEYSHYTVKLDSNSSFSILSFSTDSKGKYSFNYSNFAKSWDEYVEILQNAIDECKPAQKPKNSNTCRRHVRYGGPEAMDAFYNSQRYSRLKKLEDSMMEEFSEKNNNMSNLIADILRNEFRIFESNAYVKDNLRNEIHERY